MTVDEEGCLEGVSTGDIFTIADREKKVYIDDEEGK